jgi:hypothetical protein
MVVQPDLSDPDQTIPAAPPEVPELEVAAVKPLWPTRLQPDLGLLNLLLHIGNVRQQRQSLNIMSIGILLEVMNLCLEIHDPLKIVASL